MSRSRSVAALAATAVIIGLLSPLTASPALGDAGPPPATTGITHTSLRQGGLDVAHAVFHVGSERYVVAGSAAGDFGITSSATYYDYTLDRDNRITTDFGRDDDAALAVTADADGRITAAGTSGGDVALARYEKKGFIDWSFGDHGKATLDLGGPDDVADGVVAQLDGSVVVAGGNGAHGTVLWLGPNGGVTKSADLAGGGTWRSIVREPDGAVDVARAAGDRFQIARYMSSGALDPSFGTGGVASVAVGANATATSAVLDGSGRIVIAGTSSGDVVLARMLASGAPDVTFGILGVTRIDLGGDDIANGVATQTDDSLVVTGNGGADGAGFVAGFGPTGNMLWSNSGRGRFDPPVRFNAIAATDEDGEWRVVGTDGHDFVLSGTNNGPFPNVDFDYPGQDAHGYVVQPSGKIVVAGEVGGDIGLARYRPDGTLDTTFGREGIVVSDAATDGLAVAQQPSGRIVVAGMHVDESVLVGFLPDGQLDRSFGTDGRTQITLAGKGGIATTLVSLSDGRLLLGGGVSDVGSVLARFDISGHLDPTFGDSGQLAPAFPGYSAFGLPKLLAQPDDKVLAVGQDIAIYRFNADGALDPGFNGTGRVAFSTVDFLAAPGALAVQADGKVLVGGTREGPYRCWTPSVVRLNRDGSRDPTWTFPAPDWRDSWRHCRESGTASLAVEADGHVIGAGSRLFRLSPQGTVDVNIGTDGLLDDFGATAELAGVLPRANGDILVIGSFGSPYTGFYSGEPGGFSLAMIASGPRGAPTGLTVEPLTTGARVSWTRPPGVDAAPITAYEVATADNQVRARTRDPATFSEIIRNLPPGVTQTFRVRAVRPSGVGPWSTPSTPMQPSRTAPTGAAGWNALGQLGDGTTSDRTSTSAVRGLGGVTAVAGGVAHSLALRDDGTVWAWGWNVLGELGDGTKTDRRTPVRVAGLTNVRAIAAGAYHSLAVTADGSVWAWGWNGYGQLGDGTRVDRLAPVRVIGVGGATSVSAGLAHSLAVAQGGTVRAWGWNAYGQLGDGTLVDRTVAVRAGTISGARAVAAGWLHSLALLDTVPWSWGWNGVGQLGTLNTVDSSVPVRVGSSPAGAIAAGAYHSMVVTTDGEVLPFGWNGYGQLGTPTAAAFGVAPGAPVVQIPGVVTAVAAGGFHSVAVTDDGRVFSWGWNGFGQLGNATTGGDGSPVQTATLGVAQTAGAGYVHSLIA